ncbi:MAG: dienelactone hydrolase family protein [Saprospiraceae bacterium]
MQKYLFLVFGLFVFGQSLISQTKVTCCSSSSVTQFAELASDLTFVMAHDEPLPFVLSDPSGKNITFAVGPNAEDAKAYYISGNKNSNQWIFVFQEWWGLNDYIRLQSEKLHDAFPNAHILAIDLYDGKVATTREDAGTYMQSAKPERLEQIIQGAGKYAGPNTKVATIGWCFGGGWSNKAAVLLGDQVKACIIYYGMPVLESAQINQIKAPVLGIFADQDGWITPKVVGDFEAMMKKEGKLVDVHLYPAHHAFANPSNPKYDEKLSADAWSKSLAFIRKNL